MGDRLNQVEVLGGMAKCMAALKDFEQVSLFIFYLLFSRQEYDPDSQILKHLSLVFLIQYVEKLMLQMRINSFIHLLWFH